MTETPKAFYVPDGDALAATALTVGPWSPAHQHGGPPSALLARGLERFGDDAPRFLLTRLTVEFLKPVPVGRCTVQVEPLKLGARVQRLAARLLVDGDEVLRAAGLRVRRAALDAMPPPPGPPAAAPDAAPPFRFPFFQTEPAYHTAIEGRFVRGQWGDRQVFAWAKVLFPLVAGEASSPLQRLVTVADAESGLCPPLDPFQYTFLNPDLTVVVDREPEGEWLGLDAVSTATPQGLGIAQSALYDSRGLFGRAAQCLVVEPRR